MPEFDKEAYWKNKRAGIRGQGAEPQELFTPNDSGGHMITGRGIMRSGRKMARIRPPADRRFTKKPLVNHRGKRVVNAKV